MTADLPAIRARLAAADPARVDWPVRGDRNPDYVRAVDALIAHAPTDLAALCDEVERLRAAVQRVRELHYGGYPPGDCDECGWLIPCPTLRALDGAE